MFKYVDTQNLHIYTSAIPLTVSGDLSWSALYDLLLIAIAQIGGHTLGETIPEGVTL